MVWPVIDVDCTKASVWLAMSCAWPTRPSTAVWRAPSATLLGKRAAIRVFSTKPGAIQFTATSGDSYGQTASKVIQTRFAGRVSNATAARAYTTCRGDVDDVTTIACFK